MPDNKSLSEPGDEQQQMEQAQTNSGPNYGQKSGSNSGRHVKKRAAAQSGVNEIGGPAGPEPTRYGDWERRGRCIDF